MKYIYCTRSINSRAARARNFKHSKLLIKTYVMPYIFRKERVIDNLNLTVHKILNSFALISDLSRRGMTLKEHLRCIGRPFESTYCIIVRTHGEKYAIDRTVYIVAINHQRRVPVSHTGSPLSTS